MAVVSLEDIGKTYRGRSGAYEAVRDFSLELAEGEFFCLLGTSGCGKTTVLNMLAGFEAPTAGRITLDGRPVSKPAAERGVVFQGTDSLYDWLNARDNIAFGLRLAGVGRAERRAVAERFLALVGLADEADLPAAGLPYGERRRLELARALATEPQLLLLDEPAAGMNPAEKNDLCDLIRTIRARFDLTVMIIEHHVPLMMRLCDRLAVLNFGERIALGTPEIVRHDPAVIEAYLGSSR